MHAFAAWPTIRHRAKAPVVTVRATQPEPSAGDLLVVTAAPAGQAVTVLRVAGEIDLTTVDALRQQLTEHLTAPERAVVLDFTGVTFLAACGLRVLVETTERAHTSGVALRLVAGEARAVLRALEVTGLADEIPRADTVTDAVLHCSG